MRIAGAWVPGTASLRSWAENDEENCGYLAIQLSRRMRQGSSLTL